MFDVWCYGVSYFIIRYSTIHNRNLGKLEGIRIQKKLSLWFLAVRPIWHGKILGSWNFNLLVNGSTVPWLVFNKQTNVYHLHFRYFCLDSVSILFLKLNLESLHLSEFLFSQKSHLILFCCSITYSSFKG